MIVDRRGRREGVHAFANILHMHVSAWPVATPICPLLWVSLFCVVMGQDGHGDLLNPYAL